MRAPGVLGTPEKTRAAKRGRAKGGWAVKMPAIIQ